MKPEEKLKSLNLILPPPPKALGAYVPAKKIGALIYVSGTLPMDRQGNIMQGKLGAELDLATGQKAARLAALNALGNVLTCLQNLDQVDQIIRAIGYINATPDFNEHAAVMNGASELFIEIFGDRGQHARLALGVSSLPKNACLELELIVSGNPS